jgi:2-polyprenyl-3-methyl-5-hydroxy-6-metoxy-1,4-benzoquinol methylase
MSDFRLNLYDHYVSTYKEGQLSADSLSSYVAWCEYKFLPLLERLGPDSAILEVGCGSGNMLECLKRWGFRQVKGICIGPY